VIVVVSVQRLFLHALSKAIDCYPEAGRIAMFYAESMPHEVIHPFWKQQPMKRKKK
jgi:hypothetical protein